ncbi:MAG: ABC transporter permease [Solirubrobacterales bacterium]
MLKLFLWLKYLRRRRIILLSIAAVAMSVSLLIVVASLFSGFITTFEKSAIEMIGDVTIDAPRDLKITKYSLLLDRLEKLDFIEAAEASLSSEGILHIGQGNVRLVNVWGIQPQRRARVTGFKKTLLVQGQAAGEPSFAVPDAPAEIGGFVGIGVVSRSNEETDEYDQQAVLKDFIGRRVSVTTGTMESGDPNELPKRRVIPFRIVDVIFAGVYDLDSSFIYLPIEALQKELYPGQPGELATRINIRLKPGVDPYEARSKIYEFWGDFARQELGWSTINIVDTGIYTALQLQGPYIAEIKKQMGVLLLIFGVVSFSVVVLVFCIFYMMVKLKQRDVAVIKSCGASSLSVVGLFLGFGVSVGVAGSVLGTILGYVITRNINEIEGWIRVAFGLKLWKSSIYMFSRIPNQVDWASSLPIVGMAILAAALGALIPAFVAARTRPVEVLRYE